MFKDPKCYVEYVPGKSFKEAFANDRIPLLSMHRLRGMDYRITRKISYERTVNDFLLVLNVNDSMRSLRNRQDMVVYPEKQVAKWAAIRYTDDHILDYMEVDASHAIFEVEVPARWVGKTIGELDIRKRYNINILAVKGERTFNAAISTDTTFTETDKLLVLGEYKALQKCVRI